LENLWESPKARLLILYGRRRVGKTRLLTHWLQNHDNEGLYWVAEPASALTQLRSFSEAWMNFIDPEAEVPPDFTFSSWELAFRQLALRAQNRRIVLFIDEVTYLIDVNPDFVGTLQKTWDLWLSDSNLMLALAGSQMGLMRKHLLEYEAPLHGRATAQMQLPPLPYGTTKDYFPTYDATERVTLYAMWGGVPAYWERLDPELPIMENLRRIILPAHAWMVDESRILLQDFITDLHNYVGLPKRPARHRLCHAPGSGQPAGHRFAPRPVLRDRSLSAFFLPLHVGLPIQTGFRPDRSTAGDHRAGLAVIHRPQYLAGTMSRMAVIGQRPRPDPSPGGGSG
jgi:AAA+ ATPase superfamily predicted ATPase